MNILPAAAVMLCVFTVMPCHAGDVFLPTYNAELEIGTSFGRGIHLVIAQKHSVYLADIFSLNDALKGAFGGASMAFEYQNMERGKWERTESLSLEGGVLLPKATFAGASFSVAFSDNWSGTSFVPSLYYGIAGYVMPSIRLSCDFRRGERPRFVVAGGCGVSVVLLLLLLLT